MLALVVLTACAGQVWDKPGMTMEEWNRDKYACEVDASRVTATSPYQAINEAAKDRMFFACLEAKGYHRVK